MIFRSIYCAALAAGLLFAADPGACAHPTLGQAASATVAKPLPFVSPIFGDNMVLQRGKPDTIWGWSDPGDTVRVQLGENTASGIAGADHRWQVEIQPPAPGGPYTVTITGHQTAAIAERKEGSPEFFDGATMFAKAVAGGQVEHPHADYGEEQQARNPDVASNYVLLHLGDDEATYHRD